MHMSAGIWPTNPLKPHYKLGSELVGQSLPPFASPWPFVPSIPSPLGSSLMHVVYNSRSMWPGLTDSSDSLRRGPAKLVVLPMLATLPALTMLPLEWPDFCWTREQAASWIFYNALFIISTMWTAKCVELTGRQLRNILSALPTSNVWFEQGIK